jgi:hypothetical protein
MNSNLRTVINIHTHEIVWQGRSAAWATRRATEAGGYPNVISVRGGIAEAKAAAAFVTAPHAHKVDVYNANMTMPVKTQA